MVGEQEVDNGTSGKIELVDERPVVLQSAQLGQKVESVRGSIEANVCCGDGTWLSWLTDCIIDWLID